MRSWSERMLNILLPDSDDSIIYGQALEREMGNAPVITDFGQVTPDCEFIYAPVSLTNALPLNIF